MPTLKVVRTGYGSVNVYANLCIYINAVLRKKLSKRLDACVLDRPCHESSCEHHHRSGVWWVRLINLGFTLLNIFHLAYLGLMFGGSEDEELEIQVYACIIYTFFSSKCVVFTSNQDPCKQKDRTGFAYIHVPFPVLKAGHPV